MGVPPVKKACDACHRRKVRCSGGQPCRNCGQASLQCTYLAIPQKKGPKGSRAKVISEIRDTQQQAGPRQVLPQQNSPTLQDGFNFNHLPLSPTSPTGLMFLSKHTIDSCVNFFFKHMYPTMPIFSQSRLAELIDNSHSGSLESYCLVAALCAFIMVQPGMTLPGTPGGTSEGEPPQNRYGYASVLLEDLLRVRKEVDYIENPTLLTVQTSFFLFGCYFGLEKQNQCWFHLIEASTFAQILSMHQESTYLTGNRLENVYRRRTFWLLLVTERAYAMERHRSLSLYPTIELPAAEEPHEEEVIAGFLYLISLFRCIDDQFMGLWNKVKSDCSTSWLSELQQQIMDALPPDMKTTENQVADIKITQQWLRIMVWQLSITNGFLSSNSADVSMTFKYPIEIAKDLITDVGKLSLESMEVHGVGLIEKLFDIACTLTDVIAFVPLDPTQKARHNDLPSEYLNQVLNLISQLRGGDSRYLRLLLAKVSENLPSIASPIQSISFSEADYAGASDGFTSPVTQPNGTNPHESYAPILQHFSRENRPPGLVFDAQSPSITGSTSEAARTPPGIPFMSGIGGVHQGHDSILAPIPRSAPAAGGVKFEGYNG